MLGKRRPVWVVRLLAADLLTLSLAFVAAHGVRIRLNPVFPVAIPPLLDYLWLLPLLLAAWVGLLGLAGGYGMRWLDRSLARVALGVSAVGVLLVPTVLFLTRQEANRSLLFLFATLAAGGLALERRLLRRWLRGRAQDGRFARHALLVGPEEPVRRLITALRQYPEAGWRVAGWLALDGPGPWPALDGVPALGGAGDLAALLDGDTVVDEVFFAAPPAQLAQLHEGLAVCDALGVDARVLLDLYRPGPARPFVEELVGLPFYGFSPTLASQGALAAKRAVDVLGASAGLVLGGPLFLAVGLLIRLTSPGPALFRQERVGLHGRRFVIWKFRTMVAGAEGMRLDLEHLNEAAGPVFKIRQDPRLTPVGRVLRRTSLDELPQLVNVLRGDMSLVGPRPLPAYEAVRIRGAQRRRLAMRPGMTGLWQVSGRATLDFEAWIRLDLEYVDRWSLARDGQILARTAWAVLRGAGAY